MERFLVAFICGSFPNWFMVEYLITKQEGKRCSNCFTPT